MLGRRKFKSPKEWYAGGYAGRARVQSVQSVVETPVRDMEWMLLLD